MCWNLSTWVIYILRFTMNKAHEDRLVKKKHPISLNNLILWLAYTVPFGLWVLKADLDPQKRVFFSFRSSCPGDKQLSFALTVSFPMTSLASLNTDSWILSPLALRWKAFTEKLLKYICVAPWICRDKTGKKRVLHWEDICMSRTGQLTLARLLYR